MSSTAGALPTPVLRNAAQVIGRTLSSLLVALALVMLLRRASGAFVQPLGGVTLIVVAVALATFAVAVRVMLLELFERNVYSVLRTQYLALSY
jgi:ABC-type Fe3+ transport system permease subunit